MALGGDLAVVRWCTALLQRARAWQAMQRSETLTNELVTLSERMQANARRHMRHSSRWQYANAHCRSHCIYRRCRMSSSL